MDIEPGFPVGIGHPVKEGRLIQDQLPLVIGKAVVHFCERGLFRFAALFDCSLSLFAGRFGRRIFGESAGPRDPARNRQQQHQREEKGKRSHARTGRGASAPVFFPPCSPAFGGRTVVAFSHAHISQITSAPVTAAIKVKGMPIRVKSPVETL